MKNFCVIGHPIKHSKSPQLHQAGFSEFEIEASFTAVDVSPENLGEWVKNDFKNNFEGAAVTIPHKEIIREFIDFETEAAVKIGAVNTLFKKDGQICGTNTDGVGALKALLTEILNIKDKKVLILGAGGASRAIIFALKTAGAEVFIWNRSEEKAKKLAEEFEVKALDKEHLQAVVFAEFDIVVNATSVGLNEWKSVVPEDFWCSHQVAFDIVYDPLETKFLSDALSAGAKAVTGDKMLCFQAIEQFKIWHGIEPELEVFERAFFV